jgi:hypothetical protein
MNAVRSPLCREQKLAPALAAGRAPLRMQSDDDEPIFSLHGPAWRPAADESLRFLAAGRGAIYLLTSRAADLSAPWRLLRYSVPAGETEELELARAAGTPTGLYADPHSAAALIVTHASGQNMYVHRSRSRVLGKARGVMISAVGWLPGEPTKMDSREVLLGSASGAIYHATIEPTRTSRFRLVFSLSPAAPIIGLAVARFVPAGGGGAGAYGGRLLLVLAATPTRCYEFAGPADSEALFTAYRGISQLGISHHVEV